LRELRDGARMTADEFHRLYEQTPEGFKAELVGGVVYVASPLKLGHGRGHNLLGVLLGTYACHTPGTECSDNTTVRLGAEGEPQPDLFLRILPEYGGQSTTTDDEYVGGAPELVVEVAASSRDIDLREKYDDYVRYGVLEYLVLNLRDRRLHWFDLRAGQELAADADGVIRIRTFPGLWVHGPAVLAQDGRQALSTLNAGLATPEHAAFVQRLAAARQGPTP
jgi:Uma2 family endonuclease